MGSGIIEEKKTGTEEQKSKTDEKRSVFLYGAIGLLIFGIFYAIGATIIETIHGAGETIGLGLVLKKYFWAHIPYSHPSLEWLAVLIVSTILLFISICFVGLVFSQRIHDEALIKKFFLHIPLLKHIWKFFEKMHTTVHTITNSPFVLLEDFPSKGSRALGVITNKQIFEECGTLHARPCVFIPYSIFLPNGPILYPKKEVISKISIGASVMLKLMVTYGLETPDKLKMEKDLEYYYTV